MGELGIKFVIYGFGNTEPYIKVVYNLTRKASTSGDLWFGKKFIACSDVEQ
jgi:hypothetical protein